MTPTLHDIRRHDLAARSDLDLKKALQRVAERCRQSSDSEAVPEVFAIVNEAIRRRLGSWRLFDADFAKGELNRYEELADRILRSGPYRDRMDFYTDRGFLESGAFAESISPLVRQMGLDGAEETVVSTMVYVAEKVRTAYSSDILLPAEFYLALSEMDVDGASRFDASDEQLLAGMLLYQGRVVEMNAGEGKTIAAAFPAAVHAVMGRAVHVITANDYLAARDAEWLAPVYESLGLSVSAVLAYMDDEERRHAYTQQIVYGTLREFGFDFLRDNIKLPPNEPVQVPLDVAIVDEADHALIDQALTPLIISGGPTGSRRAFDKTRRAIEKVVCLQSRRVGEIEAEARHAAPKTLEPLLATLLLADPSSEWLRSYLARAPGAYRSLRQTIDAEEFREDGERLARDLYYAVDARLNSVTLTEKGQDFLEAQLGPIFDTSDLDRRLAAVEAAGGLPLQERRRLGQRLERQIARQNNQVNQVSQMLRAYVLLEKGVDYVVADGAVVLIDELTGRALPDTRYQRGLHAALEGKEGVTVHPECETLAQISAPGLIGQYSHVSGMTGTALGSKEEFAREYGLAVMPLPPSQPSMRADFGARVYVERRDKLAAIVDEVKLCQRVGRPVLVGTLTIEQSDEISRLMKEQGIEHNLLNAVSNSREAQVIKNAGVFGAVTIATNMAGRGTDIVPEPGIADRIAKGYASLVGQLLDEGVSTVELSSATSQEAALLRKALSRCAGGSVAWDGGLGLSCRLARAPYGRASPAGGRVVRVEVGLGLYVIGAEINRSSRIDLQLRGRSGRQGAFGASRFILSLEDQLLAFSAGGGQSISGGPQYDAASLTCYEGPRLDRRLASVQANVERDDEVRRNLTHDYNRVMEAGALAYYRARRQILSADSFHDDCKRFVQGWASRFVDRYFPGFRFDDYEAQFDRMADELRLDFEIDCCGLEGVRLDALAAEIGDLLSAKLMRARESLGSSEYTKLEKLLFVQTSDELWRERMDCLQGLMLSIPLGLHGHKGAVAEYAIRSHDEYEWFKSRVIDAFLPRLATFPTEGVRVDGGTEARVDEDVALILV